MGYPHIETDTYENNPNFQSATVVLGIDDSPFDKQQRTPVPIVAVMMAGHDQVEVVAINRFPVDGDDAAHFLAGWVQELHCYEAVQGILLGGITLAGLGIVDITTLANLLQRPVMAITRRRPSAEELEKALRAAQQAARIDITRRLPRYQQMEDGLFMSCAGLDWHEACRLVRLSLGKAHFPEPLRMAHLIGRALVHGESRGRA